MSTIARLVLTPEHVATVPSGEVQFEVVGLTGSGDTTPIAVVWSATRGTVTGTGGSGKDLSSDSRGKKIGHYKAGNSPGPDTVVVEDSSGVSDTSIVDVGPSPVATVQVSPATATVAVGATVQLTATTKDSAGNTLTGRQVLWSTSYGSVATVSSGGLVTGLLAGSALITATSEGRSASATVTVTATVPPPLPSGHYVAANGSPSGDGSAGRPWDLATALAHPSTVQPGDTIWLRAGTYTGAFTSNLNGTATAPIVVRQYPGERATINGNLVVRGSHTALWGFEVMRSTPVTTGPVGVHFISTGSRLINLVIHDASASGIGFWNGAPGGEVYGCIIYNNGTNYNLDHGIYTTNAAGTKLVADNVVFNNWKYGVHAYSPIAGTLTNIHMDGNVLFGNGSISSPPISSSAGIIVAGTAAQGISITNNYLYDPPSLSNWGAQIGIYSGSSQDVVVTGNTFVKFVQFGPWATATVGGNTFYASGNILSVTGGWSGYSWSNNVHYRDPAAAAWGTADVSGFTTWQTWQATTRMGTRDTIAGTVPAGTRVIVRKNKYEAGRANIIVYNWSRLPTVSVDVSAVLRVGDSFEVRNVQDFYGSPVLSGVYDGGLLTLPTRGITPVAPIGRSYTPAPVTGPEFNAFVVLRRGG